jgi:hypothetical protein
MRAGRYNIILRDTFYLPSVNDSGLQLPRSKLWKSVKRNLGMCSDCATVILGAGREDVSGWRPTVRQREMSTIIMLYHIPSPLPPLLNFTEYFEPWKELRST